MPLPPAARCIYHPKKLGPFRILIEGGSVIDVCEQCRFDILKPKYPLYICKYCKIPVKSPEDPSPAGRKPHKKGRFRNNALPGSGWRNGCPRSEDYREPGTTPDGSPEESVDREDSNR